MALSHMEVFDKYYASATYETLGQQIGLFNAASNNAIRLTADGFEGDFMVESFVASLAAARRRVDRYSPNDPVAAIPLAELSNNGVKIAGGFGPIVFEPSQMSWLLRPTQQAVEIISRQFAELMLQDMLNTSVAAAVAAIGNNADAVVDVGNGAFDYAAMNNAHARFGDRSSMLNTTIMNGTAMHKLVGNNLQNAGRLFTSDGVRVIDVLGRIVVVTDAPALYEAGTPNKIKALSLTEGAVQVYDPSDVINNIDTQNGKNRIETTFQSDYSFGLNLKGYSWDKANGGKSPSDAELATGANWDKVVTDTKHTAGVLTIANADA